MQGATLLLFISSAVQASVVFPRTNGPYNFTISTTAMTDTTRLDPFASSPQPRAVMISLFHPVAPSQCTQTSIIDYMPPATAEYINAEYNAGFGLPNGSLSRLQIAQCSVPAHSSCNSCSTAVKFPVLLFSPALGTSRLFYNDIALNIATAGYTVITIDHPYDTDIVTFPDGSVILASNNTSDTDAQIVFNLETRARDISFVLNQLSQPSIAKQLLPSMPCGKGFDVHKVGMFGHSLGGAAVATAMLNDSRFVAGINLDGTFFGPVVNKGLDRPFMLFGHDGKNATNDPSWATILPNLRAFKLELGLANSEHYNFSDLGTLVQILGITASLGEDAFAYIGRIDGERAVAIVRDYVVAFFDRFLKGEGSTLLRGPNKAYPEVSFVVQ